jgi:hypothetical protein
MPGWKSHNSGSGVPKTRGPHIGYQFSEVPPYFEERNYAFNDFSADGAGTPIPGATMILFNVTSGVWAQEQTVVSDLATGAYQFICDKTQTYVVVGYKAGSPDIAGLTIKQAPL